jgi:hypothetical protein
MALLDFIKNGQQQSATQSSQNQKSETAKEMYTREAAREKSAVKPMDQMPPDQQGKVEAIREKLQKATQHIQQNAPAQQGAPTDSTARPEPMRQNMVSQDKAAPALSPTSGQAGVTAAGKSAATPSQDSSAKSQEKSAQRAPQTVPRRQPSWER